MTTRAGVLPAPQVSPDDAGPWSIASPVRHAQATSSQARARRLKEPPYGLVGVPPPRVAIPLAGLEASSAIAGVGPLRVVAAGRGAAHAVSFDADGGAVRAVAPHARRTWTLPGLAGGPDERDGTDPSADLPGLADTADLDGDLPTAVTAPGGEFAAIGVRDGRGAAVAIVRLEPRELVRWVAGARCAAWSADGGQFALGGEWGVILMARREA
jgi:hypothetical protein